MSLICFAHLNSPLINNFQKSQYSVAVIFTLSVAENLVQYNVLHVMVRIYIPFLFLPFIIFLIQFFFCCSSVLLFYLQFLNYLEMFPTVLCLFVTTLQIKSQACKVKSLSFFSSHCFYIKFCYSKQFFLFYFNSNLNSPGLFSLFARYQIFPDNFSYFSFQSSLITKLFST